MIMEEQLITSDTAKLAKEKGFNLRISSYYDLITKEFEIDGYTWYNKNEDELKISAPTQSLLQTWFRDVHGIHVSSWCNGSGWGWEIEKTNGTSIACMDIDGDVEGTEPESGMFKSYELALENGLQEAFKYLKND